MKLRKMMLAIGMALAAIAAMAPTAQAEITHNTASITETDVLHYEGTVRFNAGPGVFLECHVTAELHVSATGVPTMQSFAPGTICTGGGPFVGCEIASHSFNSSSVHVNAITPDLTVTNLTIRWVYKPGSCVGGVPSTHLIFPEFTLKPHNMDPFNEHHSMDTLTISGVSSANGEGTPIGVPVSGLLHITPSQEGTYRLST